jgi:chromate transporter
MSIETLADWRSIVIAVVSIAATFGIKKMNAMYAVGGGAILGYLLTLI